jgi:SAM-dependent methyltransferase
MTGNKDRQKSANWYDGFLYNMLVTPLESEFMQIVDELTPIGSTVIDIGCGPGALVLKLSSKCKRVAGIDVSYRMITYARKQAEKIGATNVTFVCEDASTMASIHAEKFSFATMCACLHGMSCRTRKDVIRNSYTFSEKAILSDFISPLPRNILAVGQTLLEILEGRDSFRNFKEWQRGGGIDGFIRQMGLNVIEEKYWSNGFGKTILVSHPR